MAALLGSAIPALAQDAIDAVIASLEEELELVRTRRAESDLRNLSTAVLSWLTDHEGRVPPAGSFAELGKVLAEQGYLLEPPESVDPWGQA
ncbi:MAG TPA: hypothetical protein VMS76_09190, partial [Planctomycetota bacterium]|nr:hypothetical protein [Planctomycetota bacterium]